MGREIDLWVKSRGGRRRGDRRDLRREPGYLIFGKFDRKRRDETRREEEEDEVGGGAWD